MGDTACKVPDAESYIPKSRCGATIAPKRKTARRKKRRTSLSRTPSEVERPLILIHGLTDDKDYAPHTLRLREALFMAGKPHEFMPMLATYIAASSDGAVKLRQQQSVMEFFTRHLAPR